MYHFKDPIAGTRTNTIEENKNRIKTPYWAWEPHKK